MSQPRQPHLLNPDTTTTNPQFASIPYVQGTSEAIKRLLAPLGVKTSFQPTNTLRNMLVHPKDPMPTEKKSGVVYCIPCGSCPQTYIGQTGRTLEQRLKEHKKSVGDENITTSALAEHVQKTGHPIEWTQTEVVHTCNRTVKRCLLESWTIQNSHPLKKRDRNIPHSIQSTLLIIPQFPNRRSILLFIASLNIIHTSLTHATQTVTHLYLTTHTLLVVIPPMKVAVSCRNFLCNKISMARLFH